MPAWAHHGRLARVELRGLLPYLQERVSSEVGLAPRIATLAAQTAVDALDDVFSVLAVEQTPAQSGVLHSLALGRVDG